MYFKIKICFPFFQICGECGKGFYRKDHLRKHVKSHNFKRAKLQGSSNANLKGNNARKQTPTEVTLHVRLFFRFCLTLSINHFILFSLDSNK